MKVVSIGEDTFTLEESLESAITNLKYLKSDEMSAYWFTVIDEMIQLDKRIEYITKILEEKDEI